ncbi:receptor-like cytosolic serine/threonine-protein kinase RBK2 isoform X3 [Lolium perenne]|uniref:receptor-like cytosolic serine/threonine-protein kinase RBK2 isoform X3 n=1 Tax=Lolium perenne TaxID=4522 RepID=UPI0021F5CA04|nr:receptor-like cytosolic serine/threonine-protein kinase RBK2 isoform X3 [Lolium perenne]
MAMEPRNESSDKSAAVGAMSNKSGGGKSSRQSSDDLVSPRSVLDRCTTTSDNSCTAGTSTTTGVVAEPSTPESPQGDEPPSQWKGAMEAWRARTKRRLASGMSFGIRGGGSGKWRWPTAGHVNVEQHDLCTLRLSFRTFSLSELKKATRNFSKENVVGRGGHAKVYRGVLADGQLVAVKKLLPAPEKKDRVESFLSELGHAVNVRHPNVARLVGVGLEGGEHLVFPFSRLGCLSRRLHGHGGAGEEEGAMPWEARYRVALGAACGLEYLHERCARRIVHRDVKPDNILLKDDYEPLICDFGLAKWLPAKMTHYQVTTFEGTFGSVVMCRPSTRHMASSTRRRMCMPTVSCCSSSSPAVAPSRVRQFLGNKDDSLKMVDPALGGRYDVEQLGHVTHAAELCIHNSPTQRPQMSQVVRILRGEEETHQRLVVHQKASNNRSANPHEIDGYDVPTPRRYQDDLSRHKALAFDF